jgi:Ca-activated chloride channel family protein
MGVVLAMALGPAGAAQEPVATFRAGIELVRVSATVRDERGRVVRDLTASDFEVLDAGEARPISEFRHERSTVSVALLVDVSGSMKHSLSNALEAAMHLLSWLEPQDEAAVFTFDTQLDEIAPFTSGLKAVPQPLSTVRPFGATSLHDAIALTAERVAAREGHRRAVVVLTDGRDNASRLSPAEVSGIASSIDVPVYVLVTVPAIDDPSTDLSDATGHVLAEGPLVQLAVWTGGDLFVTSAPAARSTAARQIVDELRHQYLIAFESSDKAGWHPLEVRARDRDLVVRARSGYIAGQSRPQSD